MKKNSEITELNSNELREIKGGDAFMKDLVIVIGKTPGRISKILDYEAERLGMLLYN